MNNFTLTSLYYKNNIQSNFIRKNKNMNFDELLVILQCSPKKYNKHLLPIIIMLMEYLLKGSYLNKSYILFFNKINIGLYKKKISIGYWLKQNISFIFLDSFITDIYWMNYKYKNLNTINLNLNKSQIVNYNIKTLLDLTYLVKNKIQFEKYLLKKKYNFKIHFIGYNYLYYIWWIRSIGFLNLYS